MSDLAIAVLGVLGAITGLARTIAEALGARVRRPETVEGTTFLQTITTEEVTLPSAGERRKELQLNAVCVLLGIAFSWYGLSIIADQSDLGLSRSVELVLGVVVLLEGLTLVISSAYAVDQVRGAGERRLHETAAQVTLNVPAVRAFELATNAMLGIGALRSTGTTVLAPDEGGVALIQGGTGVWPSRVRGSRVTIELVTPSVTVEQVSVSLRSEAFRPALLNGHRNRRNVTNLIKQLLA